MTLALRKIRINEFFINLILGSVLLVFAFVLMRTVTHLRMYELRDSLQSFNEKNDEVRNISLLSRIQLLSQSAIDGNRESAERYRQEAESALIAIRQTHANSESPSFVDTLALPVLNVFNFITGLPRLHLETTSKKDLVLDLAFQFESFREYGKAVKSYSVYLTDFRLSDTERDFALLHRGFSYAMLGNLNSAEQDFQSVVSMPHSQSQWIAKKLIAFLRALDTQIKAIESESDNARRGELYYNAAAYNKALENFAQIDKNLQSEKVRFLTARSLEETGRSAEAVAIYRNLVKINSPYAVNANRRMYLLGTFLGSDKSLAQESKTNSETVVKDSEFMEKFQNLEKSAEKLQSAAKVAQEKDKTKIEEVNSLIQTAEPQKTIPQTPLLPKEKKTIVLPPAKPKAKKAEQKTVNLRNEKIAQTAEKLTLKKKETLIKEQKEKIDKITMADGNIFIGVVYKENAEVLFLYSVLGNLELDKTNIKLREKIDASQALK